MLKDLDLTWYTKVYLVCGYTDLRLGATGLLNLIQFKLQISPYDQHAVFLFCGRKASVIKGFVWEGDGIVILTKRVVDGHYQWPRTSDEVKALTKEQFCRLMQGLTVESSIRNIPEKKGSKTR